jgi:hypothetical protein
VVTEDIILTALWGISEKDILIKVTATEENQTLRINKYFSNAFNVDW